MVSAHVTNKALVHCWFNEEYRLGFILRPVHIYMRKVLGSLTKRPPDSAVLVIREGYVRLDGWCSRAHVSSRMVSRASELAILFLIQ